MVKRVKDNVKWVGYMDWELNTFHGEDYSITNGSSQNAYLVSEQKNVLIDTVWFPHRFDFVNNLKTAIDLKKIDAVVVNHGETDHSGALVTLLEEIPDVPLSCTANAVKSLEGQYGKRGWNFKVVKTGDSIDIGNGKKLIFIEMPFIHWPDSMATYLTGDNILFSMDAFGQHYAVEELFNDKADKCTLLKEALKYYVNIVNPYSQMVARKLNEIKAMNLDIDMIAPSHGAIWRDNPIQIIDLYSKWSSGYSEDMISIVYDTMWDGTKKLAHRIADKIKSISPDTVLKIFSVSKQDKNDIMTDIFKSKAVIVGSPTVCNDIMASMTGFLAFLKQLKFKNKKAMVFGCYGWSGEGNKILRSKMEEAGFKVIDSEVKSFWNPTTELNESIEKAVREVLL